jgi:hypothetical protein
MSAIRIVPVLLILGGLVLFALQNMSPALPLVILGAATQPFPLALWIGGAIASGAMTTLLISGLAGSRPARRVASRPAANRFSGGASSAPRNPFARASQPGSTSGNATRLQDDWETSGKKDEWDDWEEPQTSGRSSFSSSQTSSSPQTGGSRSDFGRNPQPEIRDRTDDDWQNWEGYEDSRRDDRRFDRSDREPREPQRTDFEVKRDPATRYQSGSVYSLGYNRADEADLEQDLEDNPDREGTSRRGVYDAEYRVLTPPYRPEPAEPAPPEDWQSLEEELADEPFDSDDKTGDDESRNDGSGNDGTWRDRKSP